MKFRVFISTALVTTAIGASFLVQAATEADKTATANEPQTQMVDKASEKAMQPKRHSHVEEKTGVPQSMPDGMSSSKYDAAKDPSRHLHPRDGK